MIECSIQIFNTIVQNVLIQTKHNMIEYLLNLSSIIDLYFALNITESKDEMAQL